MLFFIWPTLSHEAGTGRVGLNGKQIFHAIGCFSRLLHNRCVVTADLFIWELPARTSDDLAMGALSTRMIYLRCSVEEDTVCATSRQPSRSNPQPPVYSLLPGRRWLLPSVIPAMQNYHGFKKTANDEFLLRFAADCGGGQSFLVSFFFFFFLSCKQPTFWSWISLKTGNLSEYKVNAQGALRHCDKG